MVDFEGIGAETCVGVEVVVFLRDYGIEELMPRDNVVYVLLLIVYLGRNPSGRKVSPNRSCQGTRYCLRKTS